MGEFDISADRERLRPDAERRGSRWGQVRVDPMGGDYVQIEVRNRLGYRLASGRLVSRCAFHPECDPAENYDWDAELDRTLRDALRAEADREARRLSIRIRRAGLALCGVVRRSVSRSQARPPAETRRQVGAVPASTHEGSRV
jgi:hypothetical protein